MRIKSDEDLAAAGLTELRELNLWGTQVSDAGLEQIRQTLPNCHVFA